MTIHSTFKLPRVRPKQCLIAFCDEASQNREQFFVLGAVYFALKEGSDVQDAVTKIEHQLTELKAQSDLLDSVKWSKVPTQAGLFLDGYRAFIKTFLENDGVHFKCMVVDTHKHPLNNRKLWGGDFLVGYQKFYCVFLADGLMLRYPNFYYEIVIDEFAGVDCSDVERSVEGRYVKKARPAAAMYYCRVKAGDERKSNLLQLADLLVGAVAFAWNGGMNRQSSRAQVRCALVDWLETELKIKLSESTPLSAEKFHIWELKPNV